MAEYVEHLAETKIAQREEKRGDQKGANGTAEPGVRWHWLGWTVKLRYAVFLEGGRAILVLFPSQDHLQREESWKGRNDQSAHWQLAVRFDVVLTTSAAPTKKYAATSDLITFRRWNWLARWCSRSSCQFKPEYLKWRIVTGDWFYTRIPRGNITAVKIWTKAGTSRERRLC